MTPYIPDAVLAFLVCVLHRPPVAGDRSRSKSNRNSLLDSSSGSVKDLICVAVVGLCTPKAAAVIMLRIV